MNVIRPYEPKDKEDVRFICLNSEGPCEDPPAFQHFILSTYCDYYVEREPYNCFVAANDEDRAVGYILCAEDYDAFADCFFTEYAVRVKKNKYHYSAAMRSVDLQKKYKSEYPAHLHIDVLPEYQRQGLGSRMVDRLCSHLKEKGVKGVMLTVGSRNYVGQSFYKKYGFTLLEAIPGDVAFGIKL